MLQQLREDRLLTPENEDLVYEVQTAGRDPRYPNVSNQQKIMEMLESRGVVKEKRRNFFTRHGGGIEVPGLEIFDLTPRAIVVELIPPKFDEIYDEYSKYAPGTSGGPDRVDVFRVNLKDREVRVNEFVLSRPHAVGRNMDFMEFILNSPTGEINREDLPGQLRDDLTGTKFTKLLNGLGFTGPILRAFFPRRSEDSLTFLREVSSAQLKERNQRADTLLQALKLAHIKNNPE